MKRNKGKRRRRRKDRRRRQDLAERRRKIRDVIRPMAEFSTDGLAIPLRGEGARGAWPMASIYDQPRCNKFGLLLWSRKTYRFFVKPWANLSDADLDRLNRWDWAPNKEKHALHLLAEAAGGLL